MKNKHIKLIVILLILACLAAFGRIAGNDFINCDDDQYITENNHIKAGLNTKSIRWAFTTTHFTYWHPLTWLSHMLDWTVFGSNAGGHHLVSLLLHIGAVLFLFFFLNKTTKNIWPSAFAAALFALHPLRVESVAWATERKDVLSMFFGMASLYVYAFYVELPRISRYVFCLILFAFALMSKPVMVTLPFVMLLIDYWPLQRWQKEMQSANKKAFHEIIAEKIPFILMSILSGILTFLSQNKNELVISTDQLPVMTRLVNAIVAYMTYLKKFFWPPDLSVFYPYQQVFIPSQIIVFLFILTGITAAVIYFSKKYPFLFTGWFWYLGTLIPVIGLIQAGAQAMADRHTYLPSIGIVMILAWGIPSLFKNEELRRKILFPAAMTFLILLSALTWRQCGFWKNSVTLFSHALNVTENNALAHGNLATALLDEGKNEEAIYHYRQAIRIKPASALPYNLLGNAYTRLGQYPSAIENYNRAITLDPGYANAYNNRGSAYSGFGRKENAMKDFNQAIHMKPDYAEAYYNRGIIYFEAGQYQQALDDYSETIRLKSDFIQAYYNRGIIYSKTGQHHLAIEDYSEIIRLRPDYADAYNNRSAIYLNLGDRESGCRDAWKACEMGSCKVLDIARSRGDCS